MADHPPEASADDTRALANNQRKPRSGKRRLKTFLLLLESGTVDKPEDAFALAGYPVRGVNVPEAAKDAWYPEQVKARADELMRSTRALAFMASRKIDGATALKWHQGDAIDTFAAGLHATLKDGRPDWATRTRCAENIADRTGLPRRQTVSNDHNVRVSVTHEEAVQTWEQAIEMQKSGNQFLPQRDKGRAA